MEGRPTTSMKKGWLYRTYCDKKNHEIALVMLTQWWSRSSDDDPTVMIQIKWWSRSSDDDPDRVMIQIEWWSISRWRWLEDEDDLKMNMTWRWWELDDDPDDTEKKTCANKLCWENTFLVKGECWRNCNFRMYSLVYIMYCTPMFIPGSIYNVIESCHASMFLSRDSTM